VKVQKARVSALTRKLVQASIENGEPSAVRVQAVLELLRRRPAGQRAVLLKAYLRRMRREEALRTLVIERSGVLDEPARKGLVDGMAKASGRKLVVAETENSALIAGLRVRLGDDLYDATLKGILDRIGAKTI
jgi:F-type H+-transporting ATPase subunit delta